MLKQFVSETKNDDNGARSECEDAAEDEIAESDAEDSFTSGRSSADEEDSSESETDDDSVDALKATAIAISKVLMDLEVIETHERLEGDDFSDFLVEVRPSALPEAPTLVAYRVGCDQFTIPLEMAVNQFAAGIIREMAEAENLVLTPSGRTPSSISQVGLSPDGKVFASSSEVENDSDFESCDEEELMALVATPRGRKRGRDDDTGFEDDDDGSEDAMRTPSNSRHPRKRRKTWTLILMLDKIPVIILDNTFFFGVIFFWVKLIHGNKRNIPRLYAWSGITELYLII